MPDDLINGRAKLALTPEQRVGMLRACGFNAIEIAAVLRVTVAELQNQYADALDHGAARAKSDLLSALYAAGLTGNATSGKAWWQLAVRDPRPSWQRRKERDDAAIRASLEDAESESVRSWNKLLAGKWTPPT